MMQKGIASLTVLLIIGLLLIGGLATGIIPATFVTGGMTIQSITPVNVFINNAVNPAGYFRVSAVANRGAESIIGSIYPADFKSETGIDTTKTFSISLNDIREIAHYNVLASQNRIYEVTAAPYAGQVCTWTCSGLCILKSDKAIIGTLNRNYIQSNVDVLVSNGQALPEKTMTVSSSQTTAQLDLGYGNYVQWLGGLSTGNDAPMGDGNTFTAFYVRNKASWQIVRQTTWAWTDWQNRWNGLESYLNIAQGTHVCAEYASRIANYMSTVNTLFNTNEAVGYGCGSALNPSESSAAFECRIDVTTMNPQLLFNVDADWIGVKVTAGKPVIQSVSQQGAFYSGEAGTLVANILNDADYAGSFDISLESCSFAKLSTQVTGEQFAAHQSRALTLTLLTTGAATGSGSCTLKVCDKSGFGTCVTASALINMQEPRFCTEGATFVDAGCTFKCIGNQWVQQGTCTPPDGGGGGGGGGFDLFSWIAKAIAVFLVAAVIAGILIVILIAIPYTRGFMHGTVLLIVFLVILMLVFLLAMPAIANIAANLVGGLI